MDFDLTYV